MNILFVLVWYSHGFIQEPEFFSNRYDAEIRKKEILASCFNSDYDEIEIFEKKIFGRI
jgi:hypothetical protein